MKTHNQVGDAGTKKTVLAVDDEPGIRAFVRSVLIREGYEVLVAEDGQAAYELLTKLEGRVDVLVTDVQMPRMDGLTLCRKVAAEYPSIGILYISGYVFQPVEEGSMVFMLRKPLTAEALVRAVRSLCP